MVEFILGGILAGEEGLAGGESVGLGLWEEVSLPSGVLGPEESWALARLAAIWSGDVWADMGSATPFRIWFCASNSVLRSARC
jgi:hypothetical protein